MNINQPLDYKSNCWNFLDERFFDI